ncbi:DUF4190 domain-containing protein [Streptomyces sp. NPDC005728]|uniref:DUF4190 domain-containing protein n=1 Tax=Streptomyces sp. NPDC005728 TaxID=3157054 RepID=UPI0033FFE1FA
MSLTVQEQTVRISATDKQKRDYGDADSLAAAAFVLGLPGLLVGNIFLGPCAIVMATLALAHGTRRPGRAWLGLALGVADIVVLAILVTWDGTMSWNL